MEPPGHFTALVALPVASGRPSGAMVASLPPAAACHIDPGQWQVKLAVRVRFPRFAKMANGQDRRPHQAN